MMRTEKLTFIYLFPLLLIIGCVGTVDEKNPKASKTGQTSDEEISFAGIIDAVPVSNSKVNVSFLPAPGNQDDLIYQVYINNSSNPIEVNGSGLSPDYSGALNYTVGNLRVNTTYSFSVGVLDTKTGLSTSANKSIFATTFSNFTADFAGISAVYPASGEAGKNEVVVEWVPATIQGTQFSPRSTDPIAYEVRFIAASDGGPESLKNKGNPDVTTLMQPTTISSTSQLSTERRRTVVGLEPGTRYFFLVRAIHKGFGEFGTQPGYKSEENIKVLDVTTIDEGGFLDWKADSTRVASVKGEGGLSQVDLNWADATGPFDHYRVYNVKVAEPNETLADAEANAPAFNNVFFLDANSNDEYDVIAAENSFYRITNLESFAYYKVGVVVCANATCDEANRIPGDPIVYRVTPLIAPFSGLLSVNNPTSLDDINVGPDELETITVTFDSPVINAGFVNKMELYCFSSLDDTTPRLLELNNTDTSGKPGCDGLTRITPTPSSLAGIGEFTSVEVTADFIRSPNKIAERSYCFGIIPVIEDLTSGFTRRDVANAIIKCKVFEIDVPDILEFPGAKKVCSTSGSTINASWDLPTGGIYERFEVFYKEVDGDGFKYADALAGDPDYSSIENIAGDATSAAITGLEPGKSYTYGVLTYQGTTAKLYSDFNSGINTCKVPFPVPRFKEWVDIFAVGPKVDGRVPPVKDINDNPIYTTMFETLNAHGQPIEVEVDNNKQPTIDFANQFGSIATSNDFDGTYGRPNQDPAITQIHQYSNSGIIRIAWKDMTFENNTVSMNDLIQAAGDDLVSKNDRKFGYRVYRSSDNGLTYQDMTRASDFQTSGNAGLIHPVDFGEKPKLNGAEQIFKVGNFVDYSVKAMASEDNIERARVYYYKIVPVFNGTELEVPTTNGIAENIVTVTLPPPNMGLVHRWMANRQTCMEVGKTYKINGDGDFDAAGEATVTNQYSCPWNGLGARGITRPYVVGETVYDFGADMLMDRFEMGCNYTRGHQGNQDSIYRDSPMTDFVGLSDAGTPFKGCAFDSGSSTDNSLVTDPFDSYDVVFNGDCFHYSQGTIAGGDTACADPARRGGVRSALPGFTGLLLGQDCTNAMYTYDNYFDPYTGDFLRDERVAQSEFMAVAYNRNPMGDSRMVREYRGAGGESDVNKRVRVSGIDYRISRCSINIPVTDIDNGGGQVPRWFSVSHLNNLVHDGNALDLLDATVGEVKGMVGSLFSSGGREALPANSNSYNGRYDDTTPMAKVFASNNAKLPPLQGVNIEDAQTVCQAHQVEVGTLAEGESATYVANVGTFNKRLMRRPEGIVANAHPKSFSEAYANAIDGGAGTINVSPVTSGSNFNPTCNSEPRTIGVLENSGGGAGSRISTRSPTDLANPELITGSSFYDRDGNSASTQRCVSRYGMQDLIGNNREISTEKIFCEFTDEFLWWGVDGQTALSVNNSSVDIRNMLYNRDTVRPWVLSGPNTGQCSMVENGASRSFSATQGGTMNPLFDAFGNLDTSIVSTSRVYSDPAFRSFWRNGDGFFLDFGQGKLAAPISVNDTIALSYSETIQNRRKESPGDPRQSSYFNPIVGFPLTCGGTTCSNNATDNMSISTSEFVTLRGLDPASLADADFPVGASNIYSNGMSEITSYDRYNLPDDREGQVTFVEELFPAADSGEANPWIRTITQNWDDALNPVVLRRTYWDLPRNDRGVTFFNFGGSNQAIGSGRYTLGLEGMDLNAQEQMTSRNSFRCVVKINEEVY